MIHPHRLQSPIKAPTQQHVINERVFGFPVVLAVTIEVVPRGVPVGWAIDPGSSSVQPVSSDLLQHLECTGAGQFAAGPGSLGVVVIEVARDEHLHWQGMVMGVEAIEGALEEATQDGGLGFPAEAAIGVAWLSDEVSTGQEESEFARRFGVFLTRRLVGEAFGFFNCPGFGVLGAFLA